MEEFGAQYKPQHERLLCPQNYRAGRVRRGVRVPEGGHGQDVRHEGEELSILWRLILNSLSPLNIRQISVGLKGFPSKI